MSDIGELTALASRLHDLVAPQSSGLFLPTGVACLSGNKRRFEELRASFSLDLAGDDVWMLYEQWHETVHMAQLVTSTYVFARVFRMAELLRNASLSQIGGSDRAARLDEMRDEYRLIISELMTSQDKYSPRNIIETQAVILGLMRTVGGTGDAETLCRLANDRYDGDSLYVGLLNETVEAIGSEDAIDLLPRLCCLALHQSAPEKFMADILKMLESAGTARGIVRYSHSDLCKTFGLDSASLAKSCRQRSEGTILRGGKPLVFSDNPWLSLWTTYFDAFEKLPTVEEKLSLLMSGSRGARAYTMFEPMVTVFKGGDVHVRGDVCPTRVKELLEFSLSLHEGQKLIDQKVKSASLIDLVLRVAGRFLRRGKP